MPKWEEEPGKYRRKKPDPGDLDQTAKRIINEHDLTQEEIDRIADEAEERMIDRWKNARSEDLSTIESCEECQQKLDQTEWQLTWKSAGTEKVRKPGREEQVLEPIFEECEEHPGLISDYNYDLLTDMHLVLNEEFEW